MTTKAVKTLDAFAHNGPYSHASIVGPWIYTIGVGGIDPTTDKVVSSDVVDQAGQSMRNLTKILSTCGASLEDVVHATVYLTDIDDYDRVNEVYLEAMGSHRPARCCVAVAKLPADEKMKIDMIAYVPTNA